MSALDTLDLVDTLASSAGLTRDERFHNPGKNRYTIKQSPVAHENTLVGRNYYRDETWDVLVHAPRTVVGEFVRLLKHHAVDDFTAVAAGTKLRAVDTTAGTWNAWDEVADCSFVRATGGGGLMTVTSTAANIAPEITFKRTRTWSSATYDSLSFTVVAPTLTTYLGPTFRPLSTTTTILSVSLRAADGVWQVWDEAIDTGVRFTPGDTLFITVRYAAAATHQLLVNGDVIGTYANTFGRAWASGPVTGFRIRSGDSNASTPTCTVSGLRSIGAGRGAFDIKPRVTVSELRRFGSGSDANALSRVQIRLMDVIES